MSIKRVYYKDSDKKRRSVAIPEGYYQVSKGHTTKYGDLAYSDFVHRWCTVAPSEVGLLVEDFAIGIIRRVKVDKLDYDIVVRAFNDVMYGITAYDLGSMTGLSEKRYKEIYELYSKLNRGETNV